MTERATDSRTVTTPSGAGACTDQLAAPAFAAELAALLLIQPTPDTGILAGFQRPLEALCSDGTSAADGDGAAGLLQGWSARSDGEEQVGVFVHAPGALDPPGLGGIAFESRFDHDQLPDVDRWPQQMIAEAYV
jgi:hypothetical protein